MANTDYRSVDQYIAAQPEATRKVLERVRGIIRKALPDADEVISYQIPAYKVAGTTALFFAGWKDHYSLYPAGAALVAAFGDDLTGHLASKGTLRFSLDEPVPAKLIARIAKFKAQEAAQRMRAKAAAPKKKKKAAAQRAPARKPAAKKQKR